jgi:hypothetical protein
MRQLKQNKMATTPNPAPAKLPTKEELVAKLESKATEAKKLAGKKGVNPFIWVNTTIHPLIKKIKESAAVNDELVAEVNAVEIPKETVVELKEVDAPAPVLRV